LADQPGALSQMIDDDRPIVETDGHVRHLDISLS